MADPGRHPRDPRDDHREPGGDFGSLLVDPAGDPAGLHAASARRAYERVGGGTDLYPDGQLGVDDRTSVVSGTSVSVRVDLGGRRIITKKKHDTNTCTGRCSV